MDITQHCPECERLAKELEEAQEIIKQQGMVLRKLETLHALEPPIAEWGDSLIEGAAKTITELRNRETDVSRLLKVVLADIAKPIMDQGLSDEDKTALRNFLGI
jgi:hypothetical protein